jgi:hypothetical protein
MCWGLTAFVSSVGNPVYSITMPTGFMTTIQAGLLTNAGVSASISQYPAVGSLSTPSTTFYAVGNNGSMMVSYLLIGT